MDDNDNEGVEVEREDQHWNDIITIADDISALNTKQKAVIATPFLPASSYLSIESDLMTHIPLCPHTSILNAIPLQKCPSCIRVNVFSQWLEPKLKCDSCSYLIIYVDGISLDVHEKLTLTPLNFTLGIFNTETRSSKAETWETI